MEKKTECMGSHFRFFPSRYFFHTIEDGMEVKMEVEDDRSVVPFINGKVVVDVEDASG